MQSVNAMTEILNGQYKESDGSNLDTLSDCSLVMAVTSSPFRYASWADNHEYTFQAWAGDSTHDSTKVEVKATLGVYSNSIIRTETRITADKHIDHIYQHTIKVRQVRRVGPAESIDGVYLYTQLPLIIRDDLHRLLVHLLELKRAMSSITVIFSSNVMELDQTSNNHECVMVWTGKELRRQTRNIIISDSHTKQNTTNKTNRSNVRKHL